MVTHNAGQRYLSTFARLLCILIPLIATFMYWNSSNADSRKFESNPTIHFFSQDTAPMDGEIAVFVNYGMENRPEGWRMGHWDIRQGQHLDRLAQLPSMRYARTWFRPDGSDDWYLLPSQYWHEGGSCKDEFGVSPRNGHPSYHTHFENMIHQDDVPHLTRLDECPFGSSHYCPQDVSPHASAPPTDVGGDGEPVPTATPIPSPTVIPTPVPSPTACIVLRQGGHSPCSSN